MNDDRVVTRGRKGEKDLLNSVVSIEFFAKVGSVLKSLAVNNDHINVVDGLDCGTNKSSSVVVDHGDFE